MARSANRGSTTSRKGRRSRRDAVGGPRKPGKPLFFAAVGLLGVAVFTTAWLSASYIPGVTPPGCGADGGCAKLLESQYANLPGVGWPVAFLGFAYFVAALAGWLRLGRRALPSAAVWIIRLGALASVGYIFAMLEEGAVCQWCLATHIANLLLLVLVELAYPKQTSAGGVTKPALLTGLAAFAIASVATGATRFVGASVVEAQDQADADEFLAQFDDDSAQPADDAAPTERPADSDTQPGPGDANEPANGPSDDASDVASNSAPDSDSNAPANARPAGATRGQPLDEADIPDHVREQLNQMFGGNRQPAGEPTETIDEGALAGMPTAGPGRSGFTGRYLLGPEQAPIRIVAFMGYQCPSCRTVESEIMKLVTERDDVSLSVKQFPLDADCNPFLSRSPHPQACESARAAEAAGAVGGPEAFWRMHLWLFEQLARRGTQIDRATLEPRVRELGLDVDAFFDAWTSSRVGGLLEADVNEGRSLGLTTTPMIFINGREFTAWRTPGQLTRVVQAMGQRNLPAADATNDTPPNAAERMLAMWNARPPVRTPMDHPDDLSIHDGTSGRAGEDAAEPEATITLLGCFSSRNTRDINDIVMDYIAEHPGVRYTYISYPLSEECNPPSDQRGSVAPCTAARTMRAVWRLTQDESAWRDMHAWYMQNGVEVDDAEWAAQIRNLGLDPAEVRALQNDNSINREVMTEAAVWMLLRQRDNIRSLPVVLINGKFLERWKTDEGPILRPALDIARGERDAPTF